MGYYIAELPKFEVAGKTVGGGFMRHNDGSVVIMRGAKPGRDEDDFNVPVLSVNMTVRAKRGEAYKTSDPAQEAFAQRIVDLLNASE